MKKDKPTKYNAAKCRKCGDVIVSLFRHDFQACKCGAIYIDGGADYCRAGGRPVDFDASVTDEEVKKVVQERRSAA